MTFTKKPLSYMQMALCEAKKAQNEGEIPVGAVIVFKNNAIVSCSNRVYRDKDPTAHAEILAIRKASQILKTERLTQCDLFVTLEPCTMCVGAISLARIRRLYYAASSEKTGAVSHGCCFFHQKTCFHKPEIYPNLEEIKATKLIKNFFHTLRENF